MNEDGLVHGGGPDEPTPRSGRLSEYRATFRVLVRWSPLPQQRIVVVGSGNIDVGNDTPTRKPGQRIDNSPKTAPQANDSSVCGAMSQQGGEFRGNVSAPRKFVHLVGCRERKVEAGLEARQYSNPVKR